MSIRSFSSHRYLSPFYLHNSHRLHSLAILDLRNNAISTIPTDITKLSSLKELILCQNNINSIPTKFCENTTFSDNLRLLDLGENKLSAITPHFGKVCSELKVWETITNKSGTLLIAYLTRGWSETDIWYNFSYTILSLWK